MSRRLQEIIGFVLAAIVAAVLAFVCSAAWGQDERFQEFMREVDPNARETEPESPETDQDGEDQEEPAPEDQGEDGEGEPAPDEEAAPGYSADQLRMLAITVGRNGRLQPHPTLMGSAQALANYHARTGRWGHSSRSWRPNASENIATNARGTGPDGLGRQWVNSSPHRHNWDSSWSYVGVGVARTSSGRIYGVQHFSNNPTSYSGDPTLSSGGRSYRRRGGIIRRMIRRRRR